MTVPMQMGTNHCILTAVVALNKVKRQHQDILDSQAVIIKRRLTVLTDEYTQMKQVCEQTKETSSHAQERIEHMCRWSV